MSYYHPCPECGALLDPNEKCDCLEKSEQARKKFEQLTTVDSNGQISIGGIERELCTG